MFVPTVSTGSAPNAIESPSSGLPSNGSLRETAAPRSQQEAVTKSNKALLRYVVSQAVPNAMSQLALVTVGFTTVLFVSQLHDSEILGGVGVGSMLYNILGLSLGCGLSAGLDTLVSQSNGAQLYDRSGVHLQRAVVVCSLVCIPAFVILFFTEDMLVAIGQSPGVAARAGQYVRGTCLSLWPMYLSSCLSTFLRAQTLPQASVYATWTSNVFHIGSCYYFICYLDMGAFGAGLAFSATQLLSFSILLGYVHFVRPGVTEKSWVPWDCARATSNLQGFLEKALPCAMLMWAEWWCAEVMTLLAGYLGVAALAAHTAVIQVFVLIYMTAGGISCAGAALVGNALGALDARLAKRSAVVVWLVMLAACSVIDAVLYFQTDALCRLFTQDEEVHEQLASLFHIMLVVVPLDCLQTVIDGILRGLGKQGLAFKVKLCCMWGIRVPLAVYLGFYTPLGVAGIWWGSAGGLAVTMAIYVLLVFRVDWQAEVDACGDYQRLGTPRRSQKHGVGDGLQRHFTPVPGLCRTATGLVVHDDDDEEDDEEFLLRDGTDAHGGHR